MRGGRLVHAVALLAAASVLQGCGVDRLQLTQDNRLHFRAPAARHRVQVPVTVRWTMKDFRPTGLDGSHDPHQGAFAVFVDAAPLPVGKDLRWLARDDAGCKRDPRCPDKQYLTAHDVFVTTQPSLTLTTLPRLGEGVGDEQHFVNVVLLDGTGHRSRESAWYLPFRSARRSSS